MSHGPWSIKHIQWTTKHVLWSAEQVPWSVEHMLWSVQHVAWSTEHVLWIKANALWSMVHITCSMTYNIFQASLSSPQLLRLGPPKGVVCVFTPPTILLQFQYTLQVYCHTFTIEWVVFQLPNLWLRVDFGRPLKALVGNRELAI